MKRMLALGTMLGITAVVYGQPTETPVMTPTATPTPSSYAGAVIHYQIAGPQCNGTETQYMKETKSRRERHVIVQLFGQAKEENILEISDGAAFYHINMDTMKGTVQPVSGQPESFGALTGEETTILGKSCMAYQMFGQKTWVWERIPLKVETGISTKTATSLELDASVPDSLFSIPSGTLLTTIE